jgi:hypothetical protein
MIDVPSSLSTADLRRPGRADRVGGVADRLPDHRHRHDQHRRTVDDPTDSFPNPTLGTSAITVYSMTSGSSTPTYAAFMTPVAAIRLTMIALSSAGGKVTATIHRQGSDDERHRRRSSSGCTQMQGVISRFPCFDDSIPFAAYPLFGNLTEWDCTNEDHRPAICFRVGRMHWQPAERRSEPNCRRPKRPARGRCAHRYGDGGHGDLSHGRGWRGLGRRREHPRVRRDLALLR